MVHFKILLSAVTTGGKSNIKVAEDSNKFRITNLHKWKSEVAPLNLVNPTECGVPKQEKRTN